MAQTNFSRYLKLVALLTVVFTVPQALAINNRTTYQAKIIKPDGYPLEASSVNFRFTVLDTVGSCVLYVEDYTAVNMSQSGGLISFALGNGARSFPASGTSQTFQNTFDNSVTSFSCQTPGIYNPGPNDTRKIVMQFHDGSGWQTLPAMTINAVPYAMYASKSNDSKALNGKADTAFVENSTLAALNCNPATHAITFNGVSFSCIPGGTASAPVISIQVASLSQDGYVTSSDYAEFKNKLSASSTQIINTLGYAPANNASMTTVISDISNVSSTVTSLQNNVASSFASIVSSQWNTSGTTINYMNGNVGIGTTNPVNPFQTTITSGAGSPYVGINQTADNPFIELQRWTGTGSNYEGVRLKNIVGSGGQFAIETTQNGGAAIGSQIFTERMRIVGGNVGIGTSSPSSTLQVESNTTTTPQMLIKQNNNTDWSRLMLDANGKSWVVSVGAPGSILPDKFNIFSSTLGANVLSITPTGNVGIGTTTPAWKLDLVYSENTEAGLRIYNTNSGTNATSMLRLGNNTNENAAALKLNSSTATSIGGANSLVLNHGLAESIVFGTQSVERMRIDSSGNVGIGTTTPTAKLDVVKNETQIPTGWVPSGQYISVNYSPSSSYAVNGNHGFYASYSEAVIPATNTNNVLGVAGTGSYAINKSSNITIGQGAVYGGDFEVWDEGHNNTISEMWGLYSGSFGGYSDTTIGNVGGAFIVGNNSDSPTSNLYGLFLRTNSSGGAVNRYGLYLEDNGTSASTNNYAIYQATAGMKNYFAGLVGIGTNSPSYKLHVVGSSGATVGYFSDGTQSCSINPATAGNISCSSDERLKQNIQRFSDATSLENILKLQTVTYEWKSVANGRHTGYIAQEVEKIAPEFVTTGPDNYKQVSYAGLIPWITGAIKKLYSDLIGIKADQAIQARQIASKADVATVVALETENAKLKQKVKELDAIKAYLCSKDLTAPICK